MVLQRLIVELEEYCKLKQELTLKYKNDRKMYTASNNEFITSVIELAKNEFNIGL